MIHNNQGLPVSLMRLAMKALPPFVLARALNVLVQKMAVRRPKLFKNLARLDPALVVIEPTDLPYSFALRLGVPEPHLILWTPMQACEQQASATLRASLDNLLDMLEGRADGDMLFFSRDITLSGDTSVIVALRNTLDREEIDVFEDVTSLAGPFSKPAGHALRVLDRVASRFRHHLDASNLNKSRSASGEM